jgi:hypothetical protein
METSESDLLREQWRVVAAALEIEFTVPPPLPLPDGGTSPFAVLLPQFGGKNGMLIAAEHSAAAFAVATAAGYGVSCMRVETFHLPVDPQDYVDCLKDWGWAGEGAAPAWYAGAA